MDDDIIILSCSNEPYSSSVSPVLSVDIPENMLSFRSRKRKSIRPSQQLAGQQTIEDEFTVEHIKKHRWDERKLLFEVKWRSFPESENTIERLSYLVSLQAAYKFMTDKIRNEERDVFMIFAGLHKAGYRCHLSDDRFYFCRLKENLLRASFAQPHRRLFTSAAEQQQLLAVYNRRLQALRGPFQFKVENGEDTAMPWPFFGIDIIQHETDQSSDCLPIGDSRNVLTIGRLNGVWRLLTQSRLQAGTRVCVLRGTRVSVDAARDHVREWGELMGVAHYVYLGVDCAGLEWALDRQHVFDAATAIGHSCDPSCRVRVDVLNGCMEVLTRRNLEEGDELTLDHFSEQGERRFQKEELLEAIQTSRDCIECTCLNESCRTMLWKEVQYDESFYDYNKEEKLELQEESFKGVQFNTK